RALRRARPALHLLRQHQRYLLPTALRAVALAYRVNGRARRAARALRAALAALPADGALLERQWSGIEHGNLLIRNGRWEEARRTWQDASAERPTIDSVGSAILSLLLARAELRLDGPAPAERRLHEAEARLAGDPPGL